MNRSESIGKIASALVKAQSQMGNAVKDSKNPFFKSTFADLNSIREATLPALNANGISVLQPTTVIDEKSYVETTLIHESGEFLSSLFEVVVAKQNDPQAFGSAVSYARRYSLQSFLNVGSVDDDAEGATNRNAQSSQRATVSVKAESIPNNSATISPSAIASGATPDSSLANLAAAQANESRGSFRKNKPVNGGI